MFFYEYCETFKTAFLQTPLEAATEMGACSTNELDFHFPSFYKENQWVIDWSETGHAGCIIIEVHPCTA